ncbi:MAG TPA: CocE/NonD family hydrolase [Terrimicrobiaceae bacterium]|nr:CocE/NonD family hydrolase [Terrimicrobiaceae bacterium]
MRFSVRAFLNVRMRARDGVALATHVYLPPSEGPFPVLLVRTPYQALSNDGVLDWVNRGYAYVKQDTRGCFLSEGEHRPGLDEADDGADALAWIAEQPWCDGNIAMYGGSYVALTQVAASFSGHPALRCITPCLIGAELHGTYYHGGAFRLGWHARWTLKPSAGVAAADVQKCLPIFTADVLARGRESAFWRQALSHPRNDHFWAPGSLVARGSALAVPSFIRTGWFDLFISDVFDLFLAARERGANEETRRFSRILVGPWPHEINRRQVGEADFGDAAVVADLFPQELAFLAHFTSGTPGYEAPDAPLRLFIMGANVWRDEREWPLARTVWTEFFLASGGKANSSAGDGRLGPAPSGPADAFVYDPADPVPSLGGAWCTENVGPRDQSEIERRADVLVYSSDVLDSDLEVTGPVEVVLFASSSACDTDFTAKLVDVHPDGRALSVTDGILRATHRHGNGVIEHLVPGRITEFRIRCNPTAQVFKRGHRIRLEVSSSNFPAFARNLNTGNSVECDDEIHIAQQTVHHAPEHPSRLILPVIPAGL